MSSRFTIPMFLLVALALMPACGGDDPVPPDPKPDLDMRYDQVTWLTSHNAFAYFDWNDAAPDHGLCVNQQTSIAQQLEHGVRALQLDIYLWDNNDPSAEPTVYLCHGTRELPIPQCAQLRFTPLWEELEAIAAFLAANPYEVVTLMMEDYVHDEQALLAPFESVVMPGSGRSLSDYLYNPSGQDWNVAEQGGWPTLQWMVDHDQRLVVFADPGYQRFAAGGEYVRGNSYASIVPNEPDCLLTGDPADYEGRMFLMYHLSGPRLMNGWECPELSTQYTPDQINTSASIIARWEGSCAAHLGLPPGFLAVDFTDGCPDGQDLCDPTAIMYSGPLDAVKYFNDVAWPQLRSR